MTYSESTFFGRAYKTAQVENFKAVFGTQADIWGVKPLRYEGFKPFCGEGLVSTDGVEWERSRNILKPFFNLKNINDLTFYESLVRKLLQDVPRDGSTVNMEPLIPGKSTKASSATLQPANVILEF